MATNGEGEAERPRNLVQKLCEAGAAIGWIEKSGRNQFHGYNYATEADLVAALRGELYKRGVFIFPSVLQQERKAITVNSKNGQRETALTDVIVRWTFVDCDSGERFECDVPGCGEDSGDKGVYKAMTGSEKYLLMKAFLIPTGDDPEKDTEPEKKEAWQNGKEAAQAVAQRKIAEHGVTGHKTDAAKFAHSSATADKGATTTGEGSAGPLKTVLFENAGEWTTLTGDGLPTLLHFLDLPAEEGGIYNFKKQFMEYHSPDGDPLFGYWRVRSNKADILAEAAVSYGVDAKQGRTGPQIVSNSVPGASGEGLAKAFPVIQSAKLIATGVSKPMVAVEWNGGHFNCFDSGLFEQLIEGQGKPADLELSKPTKKNGKTYQNILSIREVGSR